MIASKNGFFLLCFVVLGVFAISAMAQTTPPKEALDAKISSFGLVGQTIYDGLTRLINLSLENKTVKEILDILCSMDVRYTWSQDGATINVYPRSKLGDTSYFLNRRLNRWQINDITDVQQGLLAIVEQLPGPREQVAITQFGGSLSYPNAWKETFQNITVRQAINRVAGHLGARTYWQLTGSGEFRGFSFSKIGEHPGAI